MRKIKEIYGLPSGNRKSRRDRILLGVFNWNRRFCPGFDRRALQPDRQKGKADERTLSGDPPTLDLSVCLFWGHGRKFYAMRSSFKRI